jgi:TolA-binding protein
MDYIILGSVGIAGLVIGGGLGYVLRHLKATNEAAEQAKHITKLEHVRKTAGERVTQMRDQIMGLNKTVSELRDIQARFEVDKRRREIVDRALEKSELEKMLDDGQAEKKGPPSVFADTQVMADK